MSGCFSCYSLIVLQVCLVAITGGSKARSAFISLVIAKDTRPKGPLYSLLLEGR